MKQCPFDAFGSMAPITFIPHIEKGYGDVKTFRVVGAMLILLAYTWHFSHFLTCLQQSFSMVNKK